MATSQTREKVPVRLKWAALTIMHGAPKRFRCFDRMSTRQMARPELLGLGRRATSADVTFKFRRVQRVSCRDVHSDPGETFVANH